MAQEQIVFPDTLIKIIDGKTIAFPCIRRYEDLVTYATEEPFVENDTNYVYREYIYWRDLQDKENRDWTCDTNSYYILSHNQKDYLQHLHKNNYRDGYLDGKSSLELLKKEGEMKDFFKAKPKVDMKDLPKVWYQLVKYKDSYYFAEDETTDMELEFCGNGLIHYSQEWTPFQIKNFKKLANGGWSYTEYAYWDNYNKERFVTLVPCKKVKGAYVRTCIDQKGTKHQSLWASEEDISNFDIVAFTGADIIEFHYEEIDFESLMQ